MTPIFYHHDQDVVHDFISTLKVPEFVRQADRRCRVAESINPADLTYGHDVQYVVDIVDMKKPDGFGKKHPDMVKYALGSCASFFGAVGHVMAGNPVACSASQGFHHAHYDHNYGFCTFNALAVASCRLIAAGQVKRVLIIDGDGHHGDGTDDIIDKVGMGKVIENVTSDDMRPLASSMQLTGDWKAFVERLIQEHAPGIIMYQAGADAWEGDPLSAGYLTRLDMTKRDRGVFTAARDAGIPLVWNLAGGYSEPMQETINLHLDTLRASDEVYYATANS